MSSSHNTSSAMKETRRRGPAYEKLVIGPLMVFGEMITGGHYLEVLRLGKQMFVGKPTSTKAAPGPFLSPNNAAIMGVRGGGAATLVMEPTYLHLHRTLVRESPTGFIGAFYRGFLPWGLIQCGKGIPVLFVQHESSYQLQHRAGWSSGGAEKAAGFLGGMAQALFVNPFQKVKVTVVASQQMNALGPLAAFRTVVRQHGVLSLYDGVVPMMMRRSLDWGIRFSVSTEVAKWIQRHKQQQRGGGSALEPLEFHELLIAGLVGGAFSASTHPIDNMITNSQKPMPSGKRRDLVSVCRRMYRESGIRAFTRGWAIKVVDNAYHMAWMYGVGTVVYDLANKTIHQQRP